MRGEEDFGGRAGGEEFLALLPNTDRAGAMAYAERLRALIAAINVSGVDRQVTASVEVALMPDDALSDKELLRHADRALYTAKRAGRDRVESAKRPTEPTPESPSYATVLTAYSIREAPTSAA